MSNPNARIRFTEETTTVKNLAEKLGIRLPNFLAELNDHKEQGIYDQTPNEQTILGWKTIERACKRHDFEAEQDIKEPDKTISRKEWSLLKRVAVEAATFHRAYGETLRNYTAASDPVVAEELLQHHLSMAEAIDSTVKSVERKMAVDKPGPQPEM